MNHVVEFFGGSNGEWPDLKECRTASHNRNNTYHESSDTCHWVRLRETERYIRGWEWLAALAKFKPQAAKRANSKGPGRLDKPSFALFLELMVAGDLVKEIENGLGTGFVGDGQGWSYHVD